MLHAEVNSMRTEFLLGTTQGVRKETFMRDLEQMTKAQRFALQKPVADSLVKATGLRTKALA